MSTCPRTSLCWTVSRPPKLCPIKGSTCIPHMWDTQYSMTQCPWLLCHLSWMAYRQATGRFRPPSLTLTVNRRCTQLWLCDSRCQLGSITRLRKTGKLWSWQGFSKWQSTTHLDSFICPQTVWNISLWISFCGCFIPVHDWFRMEKDITWRCLCCYWWLYDECLSP